MSLLGDFSAAEAAPAELKDLGEALDRHPLFHATRAELLRALDRREEGGQADRRALTLTANPAQQALLEERITWGRLRAGAGPRWPCGPASAPAARGRR